MRLSTRKINILSFTLTVIFVSFVSSVLAEPPPLSESPQNSIQSIDISNVQNGEVVAKLAFERPLQTLPIGVSLSNPFRVYFDFFQVSNGTGKNVQEVAEGDLRSVNIVQVGNRTRVVLNLSKLMKHDLRIKDNTLLVKLIAVAENQAANEIVRFAEDTPNKQMNSLRDIDFRRGANGEGRIVIDMTKVGAGVDVQRQGNDVLVEFMDTSLPSSLRRRLDVVDFATPVHTIETSKKGDNVRMIVKSNGRWEHTARESGTQFI